MNEKQRRELFQNPGATYRGKPFWSWNGELKKEEIVRQIHIMKEMGLGGYFMHSRSGLITEYLGEEWFELIRAGADEGAALEMEAWLYDEDRWPSGSAGGMVTVEKEYRMKSIQLTEVAPEQFVSSGEELLLFLAKVDGIDVHVYKKLMHDTEISSVLEKLKLEYGHEPGAWKMLAFSIVEKKCTSEFNGTTYLDTMNRKATELFLELTHEKYAKECANRIGSTIKGIFTDEPHRGEGMGDYKEENGIITCSMAWTEDLFEEFLVRYGYDARDVLPELFYRPKGERFAPVKHDYFDLANNLFLERFAIPVYEWCKEHNLLLTGHALHEDSFACQAAPHGSLMRFYEYMDYPGIDTLGAENKSYWIVKQLVSVARQLGKKWCLSELYGGSGWEYSMRGQKITGDWQALLGINVRCQHLSWYTMEGEAKRDYPGSMLHQAPWYPYYDGVESYFARFGLFMSEGTPQCDVLVINPIESAWSQSYAGWTDWIFSKSKDVDALQEKYRRMFYILMNHHIDFDYGEEQMMEQHYRIEIDEKKLPTLYIGNASYHVVIVGGMETIRPVTLRILEEFMKVGGRVIFVGSVPKYVNGNRSAEPKRLAENAICVPFEAKAIADTVRQNSIYDMDVINMDGSVEEEVFIQTRHYEEGIGFALLNLNAKEAKKIQIVLKTEKKFHLECWDFESGSRFSADKWMQTDGNVCIIRVSLLPAGTRAFVLTQNMDETLLEMPQAERNYEEIEIQAEYEYRLKEDNVCVLDKVSWRVEEGEFGHPTEVLWADRQIRDYFGLEYRSGQMLQPWYAKKHANENCGNIELTYEFEMEALPEETIYLVGERPEKMQYFLNDVPLVCIDATEFWIDDCFKKMYVPKNALKQGINTITVKTQFSGLTNVEALYLVGKFGVKIEETHNILTVLPQRIGGQDLIQYHLPFYTGEITYLITPEMYRDVKHKNGQRIQLVSEPTHASLYKVKTSAGERCIYWEPYEMDVTDAIAQNETIEVTVVASRRNVFGPLHLTPAHRDYYGPHSYLTEGEEWSDAYELLPNGMRLYLKYQ